MAYRYIPSSTPVTEPFWHGTRDGVLRAQYCLACERYYFYPRSFCPRCWSREVEWRTLSGRGTVASFSVVTRPSRGVYEDAPYVVALIELQEGIRMMSNIVGLDDPSRIELDAPVEVGFEDRDGVRVPVFSLRDDRA
jgi:uncharacterized OB-fold protein